MCRYVFENGFKSASCCRNTDDKLERPEFCCFSCQVLLINAVKDVASALSDLILTTKNASGKSSHDPTMSSLKDTAKVSIILRLRLYILNFMLWLLSVFFR